MSLSVRDQEKIRPIILHVDFDKCSTDPAELKSTMERLRLTILQDESKERQMCYGNVVVPSRSWESSD